MQVIYLAYAGAETTVFDSQVIDFLARMKQEGFSIRLYAFQHWQDFLWNQKFIQEKKSRCRQASGVAPIFMPRFPRNILGLNSRLLIHQVQRNGLPALIHARGMQSGALAVTLKQKMPRLRVLLDLRGAEPEEFLYIVQREKKRRLHLLDRWWYQKLKAMEHDAIRGADHIFSVSHALREHIMAEYGAPNEKIDVVPSCIDLNRFKEDGPSREKMRQALGFDKTIVLVYAGSLRAWQSASLLAWVLKIACQVIANVRLLILTPHQKEAAIALRRGGFEPKQYVILTTTHDNTPAYLAAGDIGIIIRDNDIINRVASPTKAGEYLAAGNLLLTTASPNDLSQIVREEKAGWVLPLPYTEENLKQALQRLVKQLQSETGLRRRLRASAARHYERENYMDKIMTQYHRLLVDDRG